jgi:hypothetical protein
MAEDLLSQRYSLGSVLLRMRRDDGGEPKQQHDVNLTTGDIQGLGVEYDAKLQGELKRVSQLGLKELWLGEKAGGHDRWGHSVGALNAGLIWLKVLAGDRRVPEHSLVFPAETWQKTKVLVATALLFHDYGHLPFSHLLNEVLESINWVPRDTRPMGLEGVVLRDRFINTPYLKTLWTTLVNDHQIGYHPQRNARPDQLKDLVCSLVLGDFGAPWVQAIVNSPIDADKIDYIGYDTKFLADTDYPVRPRIEERTPTQWLTEFLYDQEVNHAGMLCLHGRSAVAAADLWRERIFLYDRFYLAPDLRIAERMAFEIVQQFLIHATMSAAFLQSVASRFSQELAGLSETFENPQGRINRDGLDPIQAKYQVVTRIMLASMKRISSEEREFSILRDMHDLLQGCGSLDTEYRDFLRKCFECLEKLAKKELNHRDLVANSLVREPIVFHRKDSSKVRELLRPLQHTYSRDVLIDCVNLPRVLSPAHRWKASFDNTASRQMDYSILVPGGRASTWTLNSRAVCPLSDECVEDLELPHSRVLVVAPDGSRFTRTEYVWDRVRSTLLEDGIELLEEGKEA